MNDRTMGLRDTGSSVTLSDQQITTVKTVLRSESVVRDLADTFKLIGDQTRLKIILCLLQAELCVHDLATILDMTSSAVSHQLRLLRSMRIVKSRKDGKFVYYSLDDDHIVNLIELSLQHIEE